MTFLLSGGITSSAALPMPAKESVDPTNADDIPRCDAPVAGGTKSKNTSTAY